MTLFMPLIREPGVVLVPGDSFRESSALSCRFNNVSFHRTTKAALNCSTKQSTFLKRHDQNRVLFWRSFDFSRKNTRKVPLRLSALPSFLTGFSCAHLVDPSQRCHLPRGPRINPWWKKNNRPLIAVHKTNCHRRRDGDILWTAEIVEEGEDAVARRAEPLPVPLPLLWADLSLNWLPCLYTPLLLVSQPSNFSRSPSESVSLWPINRKCFNLSWVLTLWRALYSFIMQMRWILEFWKVTGIAHSYLPWKAFSVPWVFVRAPLWNARVIDYKMTVFCSPRQTFIFFFKKKHWIWIYWKPKSLCCTAWTWAGVSKRQRISLSNPVPNG